MPRPWPSPRRHHSRCGCAGAPGGRVVAVVGGHTAVVGRRTQNLRRAVRRPPRRGRSGKFPEDAASSPAGPLTGRDASYGPPRRGTESQRARPRDCKARRSEAATPSGVAQRRASERLGTASTSFSGQASARAGRTLRALVAADRRLSPRRAAARRARLRRYRPPWTSSAAVRPAPVPTEPATIIPSAWTPPRHGEHGAQHAAAHGGRGVGLDQRQQARRRRQRGPPTATKSAT